MKDYVRMFLRYHKRGCPKVTTKYLVMIHDYDELIALFSEEFSDVGDAEEFAKVLSYNYECEAYVQKNNERDTYTVITDNILCRFVLANYREKGEYFIFSTWLWDKPFRRSNEK